MKGEQARIQELAESLEIFIETQICGNKLEVEFENWQDNAEFRLNAFAVDDRLKSHVHTESFAQGQKTFCDEWVGAAQRAMDQMGISFCIERDGHETYFKFDNPTDHALFIELRDQGVLNEMASDPKLQIVEGPR